MSLHHQWREAGGEAVGRETSLVKELLVEAEVRIERRGRGGEARGTLTTSRTRGTSHRSRLLLLDQLADVEGPGLDWCDVRGALLCLDSDVLVCGPTDTIRLSISLLCNN